MDAARPPLRAGSLIVDGLRATVRAPFAGLVALSLFLYVVSASVGQQGGGGSLVFALLLAAASAYAQIACALAASSSDPARSSDAWFVAAVRRRCFWRYLVAEFVTVLAVAFGLLALVVGAFVVGGVLALGQPAAALERRTPIDAMKRSAAMGREHRRALAIVFGALVLVPGIGIQAGYSLGAPEGWGAAWIVVSLPGVVSTIAGAIALSRAFVALGGGRIEAPEEASPAAPGARQPGR